MPGSFEFMRESFPEIYADAQKAEEYLSTDNAACMLYISRMLEGIVKTACTSAGIALKEGGQDRKLADLIDELGQRKIAGRKELRILHNMRIFRNKNAHNEDTSSLDSRRLLDEARSLCGWLVRNSGGIVPEQSAVKHVKDGGTLDIISLVKGYRRAPAEYEGKHLTVKGGRVSNIMSIMLEGEEMFMLVLLSEPVRDSSGRSTELHINCCYPLSAGDRLTKLKQGQNFTASGTWKHGRLVNCVWSSPSKGKPINYAAQKILPCFIIARIFTRRIYIHEQT